MPQLERVTLASRSHHAGFRILLFKEVRTAAITEEPDEVLDTSEVRGRTWEEPIMTLRKIVLTLSLVVAGLATAQEVRFDELSGSNAAPAAGRSVAGTQTLTAGESYSDATFVEPVAVDSSLERIMLSVTSSSAGAGSTSNTLCRLTAY